MKYKGNLLKSLEYKDCWIYIFLPFKNHETLIIILNIK